MIRILFLTATLGLLINSAALGQTSSISNTVSQPTQNISKGITKIIPQVSMVVSNYTGGQPNFDPKAGYSFGFAADIGKGNMVAESGILYRQLGTQTNQFGSSMTLDVGYIALPLLAKIYTHTAAHTSSAYFKGGVIPELLVYKNESGVQTAAEIPLNELDLEGALGVGGRFPINEKNDLFLEATFNKGMTNVGAVSQDGAPIFNSAVFLTAGVGIDL